MKIFGLLVIFCLHTPFCFAQFEKGKAAVGFNMGFSYDNNKDDDSFYKTQKQTTFASDLFGEFFVHRNVSVFAGLGFEHNNRHATNSIVDSANNRYFYDLTTWERTLVTMVGIRKYWFGKEGKFGLFVMPYALVSITTIQYEYSLTTPSNKNTSSERNDFWSPYFKTDIGACYFVKPNFSLELSTNIVQAYADKNHKYVYLLRDLTRLRYGMRYYF